MATSRATVVSAPGKVLLAGGYLVLDPAYSGLVVATSSRFYTSLVSPLPAPRESPSSSSGATSSGATSSGATSSGATSSGATSSGASSSEHARIRIRAGEHARISIRAGQFPRPQSTWAYHLSVQDGVRVEAVGETRNTFIEITLTQTLRFMYQTLRDDLGAELAAEELVARSQGLQIVVLADNDFYSQREQLSQANLPPRISALRSLEPFHPLPRPIQQTNKTGLGSSAALVTSLVAGLLQHLGFINLPSHSQSEALHRHDSTLSTLPLPATPATSAPATSISTTTAGLDIVHSLAQFAHCLAQGKVGSGFDVSSAVYGTHVYRRFSPSILAPLMDSSASTGSVSLLASLDPGRWDQRVSPFRLPSGLRLMLADVDAGTDTPSFVGKVLKWRGAERAAADELWTQLDCANRTLGDALGRIEGEEESAVYASALEQASKRTIGGVDDAGLGGLLREAKLALSDIRRLLRAMSDASQVPIEPAEQTRLLDACSACPGVIGGGVPGAGGYDAIFLLVIDQPNVVAAVEEVWASWAEMSVCPLMAKQSDGGLRLESAAHVRGLPEALQR